MSKGPHAAADDRLIRHPSSPWREEINVMINVTDAWAPPLLRQLPPDPEPGNEIDAGERAAP
jgi:hypothetical protein